MNHVDALSRCISNENETCNQITELEGKLKEKILNTHESLVHRGAQAVYEKLKDEAVESVTKKTMYRRTKRLHNV